MALSLIDLFAESVLRWSLRTDRPVQDLTYLVMLAMHGGREDGRFIGLMHTYDAEQMRLALHALTIDPGLREDFLVRSLIREIDETLEDQLENFGRNKARARDRARKMEMVLMHPDRRAAYLQQYGLSERQAMTLLSELRGLASTDDGLEELARRKRSLDAWRDLAYPVLAPDLLREWREERLRLGSESPISE